MAWLKVHPDQMEPVPVVRVLALRGPVRRRRRSRALVVVLLACVVAPLLCLGALKVAQRGLCVLWRDDPVAYCTPVSR